MDEIASHHEQRQQVQQHYHIRLSRFDGMLEAAYYIPLFLILQTTTTTDPGRAIETLNRGLEQTCLDKPYLGGKINRVAGDGRNAETAIDLIWSDHDVPIQLEVLKNQRLPSYRDLEANSFLPLSLFGLKLFPSLPYDKADLDAPVIGISASVIDGGLILGFCASHIVFDGAGMTNLIKIWAQNCRSLVVVEKEEARRSLATVSDHKQDEEGMYSRLPHLHAYLPKVRGNIERDILPRHVHVGDNLRAIQSAETKLECSSTPFSYSAALLQFSRSKLELLRDAVAKDARVKSRPTLNTLMTSLVFIVVTNVRLAEAAKREEDVMAEFNGASRLGISIDMRGRVFGKDNYRDKETFPDNFFMIYNMDIPLEELATEKQSSVTFDVNHDLQYPSNLAAVAQRMNEGVRACDSTFIAEYLAIGDHFGNDRILRFRNKDFRSSLSLNQTSWSSFELLQDFGPHVGKVESVRLSPENDLFDGVMVVLPARRDPSGDEKIEVIIEFREEVLDSVKQKKWIADWLY